MLLEDLSGDHTVPTLLSHITFGFMGSYFLGLGQVLRGHIRRDLHPKTYSQLLQGLIVTAIVCSLLATVQLNWSYDSEVSRSSTLLLAFIAGIAPMEVLMHVFIAARIQFPILERLFGQDPFSGLEGIDIYERRRLELEGINNIEALDLSQGDGDVDLVLSLDDVVSITDDNNELTIFRDEGDTVSFNDAGGAPTESAEREGFTTYTYTDAGTNEVLGKVHVQNDESGG